MAKKRSFEEYIELARKIHGDKYQYIREDFDESNYITYVCPKGNKHRQVKGDHLYGKGCFCCRKTKTRLTIEEIIKKANEKHNYKYDYSLLESHTNSHDILEVICHEKDKYGNEHGVFKIPLFSHLYDGCGCNKCARKKRGFQQQITKEEFIKRAKEVHNNGYIYDENLNFIDSREDVTILCKKHGYFTQNAHAHLQGEGCPHCNASKLEKEIREFLEENKIEYVHQFRKDWLKRQSLDFYLPEFNIAIECQGIQHFKPVDFQGKGMDFAQKAHEKTLELDIKKRQLCEENGIQLLYYSNLGIEYPYNVYENKEELLNEIRKTI